MEKKNIFNRSMICSVRCTLAATMLAAAMNLSAGEGSAVSIYPNSLSAAATVSQASSIELRVAGPSDFRATERSDTGALDWYPSGLADGEYRYEVFVTVGDKPAEGAADTTRLYRENGRFKVERGTISPLEEVFLPPLPDVDDQTGLESGLWYEKLASNLLDFLVPPVAAADLITNPGRIYITDSFPSKTWTDTDVTGNDWWARGVVSSFYIHDAPNDKTPFMSNSNPAHSLTTHNDSFQLLDYNTSTASITIDGSAGTDVLRADANGDVELADGAVFIDKSARYLGVGTMTPSEAVHVVSTSPALLLEDTDGGDIKIKNGNGELSIYRANGSYNGYPFTIENNLGSNLYPGIGIWELDPEVPLHVGSHDGMSAGLLVENTSAPTAAGDVGMFNLRNTGDKIVRFAIEAGGANSVWTFDNEPTYNSGAGANSGRFRIAKSGTGVAEFTVDGYGNGRFYGTSYAVNHVNTSSREAKTDFVSINEQDVLDRLMQLPVSQWRYKQDGQASRHIGPVAEDFQQAFGLGDGKHISTVDSDGIILAAIKAFKYEKDKEVAALKAEKDAEITAFRAEKEAELAIVLEQNQALSERLSALEEAVMPLPPKVDEQTGLESSSWYEKLVTNLLDLLVPPVAAADLTTNPGRVYITDRSPFIFWNDTDAPGYEWYTWGTTQSFGIQDVKSGRQPFISEPNPAFSINLYADGFGLYDYTTTNFSIYIPAGTGTEVLRANSTGDIQLANAAVFIDKSEARLGVGTITPVDAIHVAAVTPSLMLDETSGGDIRIQNQDGKLSIHRFNGIYNDAPFVIGDQFSTNSYPGVGIWEYNPSAPLHVSSHDGMSAGLLVENTSAPTAAGDVTMFNLRNTGDKIVRFAIEAGGAGSIWTFDNDPTYNSGAGANSGRFRVAKSGTGVAEFTVDGYGNGRFYGTSYAVNHVNTSSREAKTDFVSIKEQDVLDRLMQLPLSQWRYKQERQDSRHIGPVAEDFQQAFGLGDGKHISTVDSDGIALASIKAVKYEKDKEIAALKAEKDAEFTALRAEKDAALAAVMKQNQVLSERLSALEDLLLNQQPVSAR